MQRAERAVPGRDALDLEERAGGAAGPAWRVADFFPA